MADPTPDPVAPDPTQPLSESLGLPAGLAQSQTATPQLAPQGYQGPRPILMDLIQGLIKPKMQAQPGQMARPVSRAATFEDFLGNFVGALGQGFAAAGHGPGAAARGAGAAIGAPLQMQQQQQAFQQQQAQQAAQTQLTQAQASAMPAELQAKVGALTAQPRFDPETRAYLGTMNDAQYQNYLKGQGAAGVSAQSRLGVEQLKLAAASGQLARVETNEQGQRIAYNKYGQPLGALDGAIDLRTLNKQSNTVDFKEDANGNWVALPKSTTSGLKLPTPGPQGQQAPVPPVGQPQAAPASGPAASGFPRQTPPTQNNVPPSPQRGGGPRVVMQGKSSGEVGKAFNPQTQEWEQTTRGQFAQQGMSQFSKYTGNEQEEYRQLNNRLYDVATKMTRYQDAMKDPSITSGDKYIMSKVLSDDKFKLGAFGAELPVDFLNKLDQARNVGNLSKPAQNALISYYNARESVLGYQRVLTGGSKSNEKGLELNLQGVPSPVMPGDFISNGLDQFNENVKLAGQGLPKMPGITRAEDVYSGREKKRVPGGLPRPF